MIINPENGAIEGVVDVRGLKDKVEKTPDVDVLNGIAYHPIRHTFFITGKNWSKIFEVVFVPNDKRLTPNDYITSPVTFLLYHYLHGYALYHLLYVRDDPYFLPLILKTF